MSNLGRRSRQSLLACCRYCAGIAGPSGPGVRIESSLYPGLQVPLFYDPLLAKLVVWGRDRTQAIARMRRALAEYQIVGVRTTLPFARWLMEHPRFIVADFSTDLLLKEWDGHSQSAVVLAEQEYEKEHKVLGAEEVAVLWVALLDERIEREQLRRQTTLNEGRETSRWRDASRGEHLYRYQK